MNPNRYDFTGVAEWNQIKGWFDLSQAIAIQTYVKQLSPGSTKVELGSFPGRSSVAIAAVLPTDSILYCVDRPPGSVEHKKSNLDLSNLLATFTANIERFGVQDKIRPVAMSTTQAAEKFQPESVDFLLVDAAHDYDSVKSDLLAWYPKLKSGAYLFCDDYEPEWPGVMRAVKSVGLEGNLITGSLWLHRKP